MNRRGVIAALISVVAVLPCGGGVVAQYGRLPLYFVENQGQMDERVQYYVHGRDKSIYFARDGVTFAFSGDGSEPGRWSVKLDFVAAASDAELVGTDPTEAVVSYFRGPAEQWKTGLRTYSDITYHDLWPGVDLVYSGTMDRLKYHLVVRPGADADRIRLRYRGAASVGLNAAGELEVSTPLGGFHDGRPYAYQEMDGEETEITAEFRLASSGSFGFALGDYDDSLPLVIDPAVVIYAAYIGGDGDDEGDAIAIDAAGNSYITGRSTSLGGFPVLAGPDPTFNGNNDAFVAKLNPLGTALLYAGYIGGSGNDYGHGITVDGDGNAYVVGNAWSNEQTFPVTVGPDLTYNGGNDAFVAKVNPSGTELVFAGYIGGAAWDRGEGIALDSTGSIYLSGSTDSAEDTFPVAVGPDLTANGDRDAFVAKLTAHGTTLIYAGYIGGAGRDVGYGLALDDAGSAYVTGQAQSAEDTFPVTVGPDLTLGDATGDAYVAKVNASGTALVYCGYIGGSEADVGNGIAVDAAGSAYVAGNTSSAEDTFPVAAGPDVTHNAGLDGFVAKVNPAGTALEYAGYIGGGGDDAAMDIAVGGGDVYVTGWTMSDPASFPLTNGPDSAYAGGAEAFIVRVTTDGSGLDYSGYVGGSGDDRSYGIAADAFGSAYITGSTKSPAETFTARPTFGELNGDGSTADVFIARIATGPVVSGIFNAASWMPAGLPGHGIAQGSMFVLTGTSMGPDVLVQLRALPLSTVMANTSVTVTVGAVSVDAFLVYAWTNQIAAVLPSTTPTGDGTLRVTYNGETSAPFPILVVSSAFGIFTRNSSGFGPAIVQNWVSPVSTPLNTLIESSVPAQYEILWGTGLGAIVGDDSVPPPVGNLDVAVQVLVGGRPAVVHYWGRSAEFPGIDQIQFQVPAGIEGCFVPVVVIVNGVVSNFATMAINPHGSLCAADPVSFTVADLARVLSGQDSRFGGIALRGFDLSAPGIEEEAGMSRATVGFGSASPLSMLRSLGPLGFFMRLPPAAMGACYAYHGPGIGLELDDRAPRVPLDAGASMNLTTPFGAVQMEARNGSFHVDLDEGANVISPGRYTFDNGIGGADVGTFQASLTVSASQFVWANEDAIEKVSRTEDLLLTWTGGDDASEVVLILGFSSRADMGVVGSFLCAERVSAGQFVLPAWLLSSLPASSAWDPEGNQDPPMALAVGRVSRSDRNRFTAQGLDAGFMLYFLADVRLVPYE